MCHIHIIIEDGADEDRLLVGGCVIITGIYHTSVYMHMYQVVYCGGI